MKKKLFTIFALLLFFQSEAQTTIRETKQGNYIEVSKAKDSTATGKTFTDKEGKVYAVYATDKGKLFVPKISAKGNYYRKYLKIETN